MLRTAVSRVLSFTALTAFLVTGCSPNPPVAISHAATGVTGAIHGGQQPISGATIQLYAVGTTGDGSAATPLLTAPVTSDANGNWDITNLYTCPTPSTLVYIVGTGGSPASSVINPQIALLAVLGTCSSLATATFVDINEVTTVAAIYPLAPYITSFSSIGSGTSDATTFATYFSAPGYLANFTTGTTPGSGLPSNYTVPVAQINTIADLLAACINSSGGVSGDTSICGQFFALTLPSGGTPSTDTIAALLNLAKNPTLNTTALYNLIPPTSPFQPTQPSVPPDFSVRLTVPSAFTVSPSSVAFGSSALYYATQPNQTITVTNGTAAAVSLNNTITGVNASDFGTPVNNCGSSVAPNSSCTYQISFVPTASGARAAYFVLGNSSANPSIAIPLSGTGNLGPALVTLTPNSAAFPSTNAGSSSSMTFTLTNLTTNTYDAFSSTSNGAFTQSNNCPSAYVLPAGGSCTITVTFSPSTTGPQSDTLTVKYYNSVPNTSATLTAALSGVGTAPGLSFSTNPLQFPNTPIGTAAPTQTVALFNYGTGPALNPVATISGAGASSFSQTNNCPASLAVNASCIFTITAAPTQIGTNVGTLTVTTAGSSASVTTLVTGTAGNPTSNPLVLSDTQFYVPSGGSTVLTLTNTGSGPVTFAALTTTTGFSQTNTCGIMLAAGATCNVQLSAAAVAPYTSPVSGTLTVVSNAQTPVQTAALYTANATNVYNFGSANVGYPSLNLSSTNCGSIACTPVSSGPAAGDFTYQGSSGCSPRSGQNCIIYTQFIPSATGHRIATSSPGGYFTGTLLVGNGIPATGQVTSFSISAASINLGTDYIGYTTVQPVTITLTNTGNQPVPINSITTTSFFNLGYQFPQTNTCGSSLAVGSTCTISVSFSLGLGGGGGSGQLLINTFSTTPSIGIPISINAFTPQLNFLFSSTNVTLAQALAGTSSTAQTITLSNTGNVPMTVTTGPYTSGGGVFTYATTCGTVAAGGNCTITVNGTPPSAGNFSGVLPVAISGLPYFNGGLTQNINVSVIGN